MDETEFHDRVRRSDAVDDPEPPTEAALETLGEALSSGQAEDVADWLPDRYAETIRAAGDGAESIEYETFVERIEERDDGDDDGDPRARAGAVADALAEALPHEELLAVRSQLTDEVSSLFTEGTGVR